MVRVLCDDTVPSNEWVWSKVRSNDTVFSLLLEKKTEFKKSAKLKRHLNGRLFDSPHSYFYHAVPF